MFKYSTDHKKYSCRIKKTFIFNNLDKKITYIYSIKKDITEFFLCKLC